MSRFIKRFLIVALAAGSIMAASCLLSAVWSRRQIAAAQASVTREHEQPTTLPIPATQASAHGPSIRVAVIGGMVFTGFWNALADRYQSQTGMRIELIAAGPKNDIVGIFKKGGVDVITMHSSDAMINLVADGYTLDPQPWMRNDLVIVGPPEDPAGIRGMTDAAAALRKIAANKSPFVVHSSLGAQEVLLSILEPNQIQLDPAGTAVLFNDTQRDVLKVAGAKHAYTLVGRIPFRTGRLPNNGLVLMVQGDERLRRPYLVAVTNPRWMPGARVSDARRFANWLRSPATQAWIADFGKGTLDTGPMFFPITLRNSAAVVPETALRVEGDVTSPLSLTRQDIDGLPHVEVRVTDRTGEAIVYSGVTVKVILKAAGVPLGDHRLARDGLSSCVVICGADGYKVAFSMAEFDDDFGAKSILLADRRNGKALASPEGPLRLVVPTDKRNGRWVRGVVSLSVVRAAE